MAPFDIIKRAKAEIEAEDIAYAESLRARDRVAVEQENARRSKLPPEDRDHICGMGCDGQDGSNSYCSRLRRKLFGT